MEFNFDLGVADQRERIEANRRYTIGDLLEKRARTDSDAVAIRVPDREITYALLRDRVAQLSNALLARGHEPGSATFAIISENRPEFIEVLYAGAVLGCLVAAQNWRLEREELVHCIDTVEPDVVFVSGRHDEKRRWIDEDADTDPAYVILDEVESRRDGAGEDLTSYEDLVEESDDQQLPDTKVDPEQGFVVMYTSGTTGMPKGAVISHRAEFARTNQVIADFGLEHGDSYPSWAPMFHMGGIDWVVTTAVLGGTYYPIDGFDPDRIVEVLQTAPGSLSWLILFPGMLDRFLDALESTSTDPAEYRPLRAVGALLDLMNREKMVRIAEILGAPANNTYGSTETGHVTSGNQIPPGTELTEDRLRKEESSNIQVRLLEDGRDVGPGESGEVVVRGPPLFSGYVQAPEANREDFDDGWFYTGDIMERHEDSTYSYVSRRKYMIKPGGENVYPAEIENVLIEHELVDDICVVKQPDEKWGEVPRAVVGSQKSAEIDPDELLELLEDRLANYKLPHYIQVVEPDDFPRNATGKIVREDVESWDVNEDHRVREV